MINCAGMMMFCWILLTTTRISGQLSTNYIGCFVDNGNNQEWQPSLTDQNNLTIEICIQKCYSETSKTKSEMTFAALANGRRCTCRNNFGQELRDRNCNVKCSGSRMQNCGGNLNSAFYSLYTVCSVGYFGPGCNQLCHCKRHLPCGRKTGFCSYGCDEQWNGASCNISNIETQYIGCYGDGQNGQQAMDVQNPGGRTGSGYIVKYKNSNEFCIEICSTNNYTYAGMQYGFDCHCGEKYNKYGDKTYAGQPANCSFLCPANTSQKCGGSYSNSIYHVCPVGFYGRNCTNRCQCNGSPCRFNGSCLNSTSGSCKPGWMGSACTMRDCGLNNGDCESDEKCETVDLGFENLSVCRCKDGSYRDNNSCRPTHLHYVGCYKGNTTQYDSVEVPTNDTLTIEFCMLKCRQLNKSYSIIQGGTACLCGDDYSQISPDDECQIPCAGSKLQYCGGKNTKDGTPIYAVYTASIQNWFLRQYIGCYKDAKKPAMEFKTSWEKTKNNSIEFCTGLCASLYYKYAGLQYRFVCFCGNSYDGYGSLPASSCYMICDGNRSQICGGNFANSVYAVNNLMWCSIDADCKVNESCNAIDLNYENVSRCRCKEGYHRMTTWEPCTDVDECKTGISACDPTSEICINNIGSYRCECKSGFANLSGKCVDIDECSNDLLGCDCERELCKNTIGSYQCHCKPGYEYSTFGNCTDVDECQLERFSSPCNSLSEYCINSIGSYSCYICFANIPGNREEISNNSTIGIILGSLLAISLLINALLVISRIKSANSNLETCKVGTQSDIQPSCVKISDQQEMTYDEIPTLVDHGSVYERIILEKRQMVQDPTSEYAALKHDDYLNVETST